MQHKFARNQKNPHLLIHSELTSEIKAPVLENAHKSLHPDSVLMTLTRLTFKDVPGLDPAGIKLSASLVPFNRKGRVASSQATKDSEVDRLASHVFGIAPATAPVHVGLVSSRQHQNKWLQGSTWHCEAME